MKPMILLILTLLVTSFSLQAQDLKLGIPVGKLDSISCQGGEFNKNNNLFLTHSSYNSGFKEGSNGENGRAFVWHVASGKLLYFIEGERAKFSNDGTKVFNVRDQSIQIFDTEKGTIDRSFKTNLPGISNVQLTKNNEYI